MAPNNSTVLTKPIPAEIVTSERYNYEIKWTQALFLLFTHLGTIYGLYLVFTSAKIYTTIFGVLVAHFGGFGTTAGAHRLWSHKSYKAKLPLRIILGVSQTLTFQESIYQWARNHRVHHKYTETDADPHNPKRGLFFSHWGWLLVKKHPQVTEKGKTIDCSDLLQDGVVAFQKNYYYPLAIIIAFVIPTVLPMWLWNETFINSYFLAVIIRWTWAANAALLINSVAHKYGTKPFDKSLDPANNAFVHLTALGEGWHNYHHAFPWDYKSEELGNSYFNVTTALIDFFAWVGWAYDLKTTSPEHVLKRAARTGDGTFIPPSHYPSLPKDSLIIKPKEFSHEKELWEWNEKDFDPKIKENFVEIKH